MMYPWSLVLSSIVELVKLTRDEASVLFSDLLEASLEVWRLSAASNASPLSLTMAPSDRFPYKCVWFIDSWSYWEDPYPRVFSIFPLAVWIRVWLTSLSCAASKTFPWSECVYRFRCTSAFIVASAAYSSNEGTLALKVLKTSGR